MLRRTVIAALLAPGIAWAACMNEDGAGPFIEQTGRELAAIMAAPDQKAQLLPFLDRVVDVPGMARFCLGRYWQTATGPEREAYLRLFRALLANGLSERLASSTAKMARVQTSKPECRGDEIHVPTLVERAYNKSNRIVWVVVNAGTAFRIVDVTAEGISLRITQRSDTAAFLQRQDGSIGALVQAMEQKTRG